MSIKAIIPSGQTELTVNGLHQWDYGQVLEIHSNDLPALIEVHFACSGMAEAVVRSCAVTSGVAKASIPDSCIEQTSPIIAWIYCVDKTSGYTAITIRLPVIARAKPAPGAASIPTSTSDKYTEAVAAMNAQVAALKAGTVVVGKATTADSATTAASATKATSADNATTAADSATTAGCSNRLKYKQIKKASCKVGDVIAEENFIKANTRYRVNGHDGTSDTNGTEIIFSSVSANNGYMNILGGTIQNTADGVILKELKYFKIDSTGAITQPYVDSNITTFSLTIVEGEQIVVEGAT